MEELNPNPSYHVCSNVISLHPKVSYKTFLDHNIWKSNLNLMHQARQSGIGYSCRGWDTGGLYEIDLIFDDI